MTNYPLLDIFWTMFLFFCWALWIWLVCWILIDIFRSDLSGWKKAGWTLLVILVPLIGVIAYEIVHGDRLFRGRDYSYSSGSQARAMDDAYQSTGNSSAYELSKLADLHQRGAISDAEYARGKEKILS
jgi:Short C-terminal domain/Phospholipase_D-nuclease N-terminal